MNIQASYETLKGEHLKTAAEIALHRLGSFTAGQMALEGYATVMQGRVVNPALQVDVAGVSFENPVIVGAGWDKKGRAVNGLYHLGFAGVEVGTVTPFAQPGNPKPRLWTITGDHTVGFNRLGYNSPGVQHVGDNLEAALPLSCPIGLSVGRNKNTPNNEAAADHSYVIRRLGAYASYIVLAISSPGTPGLRDLQGKEALRELVQAAQADKSDNVPLFVKIDSERSPRELDDIIGVLLEESVEGIVATNSYMGSDLKQKYGERWAKEPGGLSGADPEYRKRTTDTIRHIHEVAGDRLVIIGVGGVNSADTALEKIRAGASLVQVVTAIRPSLGRVAATINRGLLEQIERDGAKNIRQYIGIDTRRSARDF